ncbi:response regulator [Geminocystis sp. NIES-3709]|uniref:response regulator n=1 Tax=Geminocystis sp. NIES-3709 TaxID=1617448 RepID=UPI0005FC82E7|nr:response regulator [Geminocystis sp. NIES-3709]BAQ66564.1 sensor histidine kinase [Geminocystis sp. NIES-3709]
MLVNNDVDCRSEIYQVLIIEDSLADFELYQKFLQKDQLHYYKIEYAETATEGLDFFRAKKPDFVIVDYSLPDMNGLKLISAIKKLDQFPEVPIIMMTGLGNEAIALQAMKQNIQDYLVKSDLDFHKFINTIYNLITLTSTQNFNSEEQIIEVLLIDDSELDLKLYQKFLTEDQNSLFNVYTAKTAQEALNFLKRKEVDVIVTDYQLPDMNGIELIKNYQKFRKLNEVCIILMTGFGNEKLVVDAFKNGVVDYFLKENILFNNFAQKLKENVYKIRISSQLKEIQLQKNLLSKISLNIRKSLELEEIIQTSVTEIKKYLLCDRVLIYKLNRLGEGKIIAEEVNNPFLKSLGLNITDTFFEDSRNREEYVINFRKQVISNINESNLTPCHQQLLKQFQVKSIVTIPIIIESVENPLWGVLVVHFCKEIHYWKNNEISFLNEVSLQITIAIQQGLLLTELKKQRDIAYQATQAKSAFLANMSHEIRTPMNGILGMAEMLSFTNLTEEQKDYLTIIESSGKNLLNLINDILDLSKLEAGKIELHLTEFILQDIVKELINLFSFTLKKKNLTIELDITKDLPVKYLGDCQRLKQILINLVGNAIKFTSKGNIKIIIKEYSRLSDNKQNEIELYFAIQDSGIGINLEDQKKLFLPFSQVENSTTKNFQGTGLGLSICKKLVELMGGNIGIKSNLDQGSTFWFTANLKSLSYLSSESLNYQTKENIIDKKFIAKQEKILLVEDNKVNQIVVKNQLKKIGYKCDIADNGQIALDLLKKKSYDLIFMDCQMPILDGYDTTLAIRQNEKTKDMIIIGLTAFAMEKDKEKCIDSGMNSYLSKPCNLNEISSAIKKWIKGKNNSDLQ